LGLSDNVVIDTGYPAPIATVTVIASSKAMALNTVNAVVKHFEETVQGLQDAYGVQSGSLIMTRRLDTGKNLEETGGKVKRAFIAVIGAGVLLSVGATVGFDAIARRRTRKVTAPAGTPATDEPDERNLHDADDGMPRAGSRGRSGTPIRMNGTADETIILPRPQVERAKARSASSGTAGIGPRVIRQRSTNGSATSDNESGGNRTPQSDDNASDRTMVLPRATADGGNGEGGSLRA
jgi:hypothetical protein